MRSVLKYMTTLVVLLSVLSLNSGQLVTEVGRALERISNSNSSFSLVPGLRFDPKPVKDDIPIGNRKSVTLLDSAEDVFLRHNLVWDVAPGIELRIVSSPNGKFHLDVGPSNKQQDSSRTFGVMRRMKMVLLPIMYKLGVITTLLTVLTVFALKSLTLGVLLLVITSVGVLSKFKTSHEGHHAQKDVHVHVHGGGHTSYPSYHDWDRNYMNQQYGDQRSPWDSYIS